jgi:ergothioneine biosynthesis protein EgtB
MISPKSPGSVGLPNPNAAGLAYRAVRAESEALAAPLTPEDCALQSMPDASPVKWHLAHTTWFFETFVLAELDAHYTSFDPGFRVLFNSYYNSVGEQYPRPARGLLSRPSLGEVLAYRGHVDRAMQAVLAAGLPAESAGIVELGLHHEQQHQELLLTDVKHLFAQNPRLPVYRPTWPLTAVQPAAREWIAYAGGLESFGHRDRAATALELAAFAFDNEGPQHQAFLAPFLLASHPVTNGDFIAFIADGGYRRPDLWLALGWDAVQREGWSAPLYWRQEDKRWQTFTLHGAADLDPHAPVTHVSFFEADAYARWAEARLPTEYEWELAARDLPRAGNFVESGALHPLATRERGMPGLPQQMYGDVWEWTQSAYLPYPGFQPGPGAIGEYNGKFMASQMVLRGGSCVTPQAHIRATYRNFFPLAARWQFSGLRLARDAP